MKSSIAVKSVGRSVPSTPPTAARPRAAGRPQREQLRIELDRLGGGQPLGDLLDQAVDVLLGRARRPSSGPNSAASCVGQRDRSPRRSTWRSRRPALRQRPTSSATNSRTSRGAVRASNSPIALRARSPASAASRRPTAVMVAALMSASRSAASAGDFSSPSSMQRFRAPRPSAAGRRRIASSAWAKAPWAAG